MEKWAADFETTTEPPARVWLWAVSSVDDPEKWETGESIETFIEWMQKQKKNPIIYFHNQKFDGTFIIDHLLRTGWNWKRGAEKGGCKDKEFTSIIGDDGKFFSIELYFSRTKSRVKKATILDSLKLIPFSIAKAAKDFGLSIQKLSIDYAAHNDGSPATEKDIEYIERDVKILSNILKICEEFGITGSTIGACAMRDFKRITPGFSTLFPELPPDDEKEVRKAYRGGWVYLNPDNACHDVGRGISLDCNSMYGGMLEKYPMPFGFPLLFFGEYEHNEDYPLYVQRFRASFKVKNGKFPFVQSRNCPAFIPSEYIYDTDDQLISLSMCNADFELFKEQYEIKEIIYDGGYMFRASKNLFPKWVQKWSKIKYEAENTGNKSMRTAAKLMIAALPGKFATNPEKKALKPELDQRENKVKFKPALHFATDADGCEVLDQCGDKVETDIEVTKAYYIPVGVFTLAYARAETVRAAQHIHDESIRNTGRSRFCYAATDSLHLIGDDLPDCIEIDRQKTGAWKIDGFFNHAKFLAVNRYVELMRNEDGSETLKVRCSGLPESAHSQVTFDNFNEDAEYTGKLVPKVVPGGVILKEQKFHMKARSRRNEKCLQ